MKFCLVSGSKGEDVKQHFLRAAKKHFSTVTYAPLDKISIDGGVKAIYRGTDLATYDAVYVRAFNDDFLRAEVLLSVLERTDVYLPVSLDGYQLTNHKFHSIARAARIGIPVPDSSLAVTPESSLRINKEIGFPVVLKLLRGFGGKGVMLLRSEAELKPVLDTLQVFNEFPSGQKYLESGGRDIRAIVIGDETIGIRRQSTGNEWRANVSSGGSAERIDLPDSVSEMARNVASLFGLDICAVDFIESADEAYMIEVNFTPGIMAGFFGSELAEKMMAYVASRSRDEGAVPTR